MTNRAQTIIEKINNLFVNEAVDEDSVELLEGSLPQKGRFRLRMYHPQTQKLLFTANANSKSHIKSLLASAAKHLKTGGMDKVRVSVQDQQHGMTSDHQLSITPKGHHISNLSHVDNFED